MALAKIEEEKKAELDKKAAAEQAIKDAAAAVKAEKEVQKNIVKKQRAWLRKAANMPIFEAQLTEDNLEVLAKSLTPEEYAALSVTMEQMLPLAEAAGIGPDALAAAAAAHEKAVKEAVEEGRPAPEVNPTQCSWVVFQSLLE
jgi:hypothetical protein